MPLIGSETPRLWTPPARPLTPATSKGFEVITFADQVLGVDLMPWQRWLLVHALELNEDGTYRWRVVIVLVARQNGKTTLLKVLALWRILLDGARLVLGTSTNLDYARESWEGAVELAENSEYASPEFRWPPRRANGEQTLTTRDGARYKIAAATRKGGRSLSVDLGIADELREHHTWDAWAALSGTTTARPDAQLWALSNAGDDKSVVLNHFRDSSVGILTAGDDPGDTMLAEWSAPEDAALDDWQAIAQANPALGHTITERTILGKMKLPPAVYKTEHMCIRVRNMDDALDLAAFADCLDRDGNLDGFRDRVALCLDVSPDLAHVALYAAAVIDERRTRVEPVAAWSSTMDARDELPDLIARIKPRAFGWFPGGPAAALAADLAGIRHAEELKADVPAVCQGFAEQIIARRLVIADDPLLSAQASAAGRTAAGDGWRFTRKGAGHVDAVYAAAGAVHLARTLPPPRKPLVLVGRRREPAA